MSTEHHSPSPTLQERILLASRVAFNRDGYVQTVTSDLARILKISKKTLYKVFPSKEELLQAVVDEVIQGLTVELEGMDYGKRGYLGGFLKLFRSYREGISEGLRSELLSTEMTVGKKLLDFENGVLQTSLIRYCKERKADKKFADSARLPVQQGDFLVEAIAKGLRRKKKQ